MILKPPYLFPKNRLVKFLLDKKLVNGHGLLTVTQNMCQVFITIGKLNAPVKAETLSAISCRDHEAF
jgi:hypothetical protein